MVVVGPRLVAVEAVDMIEEGVEGGVGVNSGVGVPEPESVDEEAHTGSPSSLLAHPTPGADVTVQ